MVIAIRQIAFVGFQQKPFRIYTRHTHTHFGFRWHTHIRVRSRIHEKPFSFLFLFIISSACIRSVSFARMVAAALRQMCSRFIVTTILRSFPLACRTRILPGCTSGSIHLASSYSVHDALTHAHTECEKSTDVCVCAAVGRRAGRRKEGQKSVVSSLSAALWGRIRSLEMLLFSFRLFFPFHCHHYCSLAWFSDDDDDDAYSFVYSCHHQTKTGSASCIYTNKDG